MTTALRKTEIAGVGEMSWGPHFCLFYETKQDLLDLLVPYFKAGLESNEFCVWVIAEPLTAEDARNALHHAVPELERYLAERSIEILPHEELYLKGGAFERDRVLRGWQEKFAQALARGYAGMRVDACTAWLQKKDWQDFRAYEAELSASMAHQRMIVLCAYSLAASSAVDILDVAHTHQVAVTMRHGNAEVVETPELKQAKTAIQRLSEELEQRVVERTRELAAANEELRREISERKRTEEKLRLSEERLRLVVETIPGLVWSALPDGFVEFVNHTWLEYTGLARNDILGWAWEAMIEPTDLPAYVNAWRVSMATGEPFEAEARIRRADGVYRWFLSRGAPLRDELGNIVKWYGTSTDIEEQKQVEEQSRTVIDVTPQQIWSGPADGSIDYCNDRWRAYHGLGLEELQGDGWQSMLHPDDRDRELKAWHESVVNGTPYEQEERHRGADGTYRWFLARGVPQRDTEGRIKRWYGTNTDIEDPKRIEEQLRQREGQLAEAQRLAHIGSWNWDFRSSLITLSDELYRIFGLEPKESGIECEAMKFIHPEDRDLLKSVVKSSLKTNEPYNIYFRVLRPDGEERIVHSRGYVVSDDHGTPIRVFGTTQDITERKRTEEALERAFQEIQVLKDQLYQENLALREEIDTAFMFEEIVGASPALHAVLAHVAKVAPTDSTVLITGETGTGKELIARAIHKRSPRASHPFVSVNCAAIPPSLVASELFGHEKGAFTSALQRRLGRFELANGGTLFLDEIGELPTETQNALLRVLQEREFERVGGNTPIPVDVRVIAATNRDLQVAIAAGAVRSDLFYRLNVFPIELPPLRDRKADIPLLIEYFLDRYARKAGKKIRSINPQTLELLQAYSWPGNIRELQNVIERSVILCETETFTVDASWLAGASVPPSSQPLSSMAPTHQRKLIEAALAESRGRVAGPAGAAAKLGMPPSTLESKIRALKINKYRFKTD